MSEDRVGLRFVSEGLERVVSDIRRYQASLGTSTRSAQRAQTVTERLQLQFRSLASSVAVLDGPLGGVASRINAFATLLGRTGLLLAATGVAITGLGTSFNRATRNVMETETAMLSLQGALRLSGNAAGFTAKQLDDMALAVEAATLANRTVVRNALVQLTTFERITGDIFERTIWLAQDFSQVFGTSIDSATQRIARALDNPVQAIGQLERSFGRLDDSIRDNIFQLARQGNVLEAQNLLLQAYEERIGGIAKEAATGIAGGFDTLSASLRSLSEAFGENIGVAPIITTALTGINRSLSFLTENMDRVVAMLQALVVALAVRLVAALTLATLSVRGLVSAFLLLLGIMRRILPILAFATLAEAILRFTRLVRAVGSFGEALVALRPLIDAVVQYIVMDFERLGILIEAVFQDVITGFWSMLESMTRGMSGFLDTFSALSVLPSVGLTAPFRALGDAANAVNDSLGTFTERADASNQRAAQLRSQAAQLGRAGFALVTEELEKLRDLIRETEEMDFDALTPRIPTSPYGPDGAASGAALENLTEILAKLAEEQRRRLELLSLGERERVQKEIYYQIVDQIGEAEAQRHAALISAFTQEYTEREFLIQQMEEHQARVEQIGQVMQSSMERAFMSIVDGTASTKDAFRSMARDILSELYRVLVVQQMVGNFSAGGGGILGAIFGAFNANGNAYRSGSIVPFANGGVVNSPMAFPMSGGRTGLMGEAGPEAIMPLKRGRDGKLGVVAGGETGGAVVNQTFNFNMAANGDESVKRIVAQAAPQIVEAAKSGVLDARRRGGAFRSTFG